ncbi:hypothetical protein [Microbacterium sp.]|uniref:hypothetical protein n=1 Tax=Microbacterium sp. TaxID=51671 RepID=UPI003A8DEB17
MVATVLRLRYRVLFNTLVRSPWQLVGFIFGGLWALGALLVLVAGLVVLAIGQGPDQARTVVVLGGGVLLLGWVIGPVLVAGSDTTVDAGRLAPFPLSRRQTMLALAGTGLTGIPGVVTTLAALATVVVWARWPAAAVAAVVCAVIAVITCVVAGRLVATLSLGLGAGRRWREIVSTVVLALLILTGPIITGMRAVLGAAGSQLERLAHAADVLAWTPLGAAWAVPADVSAGAWPQAIAKLAIAVATVVVLWLLWAGALAAATASPPRRTARTLASGALGLFGRLPTGGVGATWARSLTAWTRDPRYLRQLIFVPLFPILLAVGGGVSGAPFAASSIFVAFVLAIAGYTDISYDGTAFATVLATGVRGRHDRLGRMLGAGCIGIPAVVLAAVVTVAIADRWMLLPAVLGAALAVLLGGYAASAVSSALIITPVSAPGDSPFKTVPGQTFVNGLLVFVVMGAALVLALPALILAAIGVFADLPAVSWAALGAAVLVGVGAIAVGVIVGGRVLDRTGPDLLQRIKALPTT